MNESLSRYASSRDAYDDQLLSEAAKEALKADPTPRMIKFIVDHDGSLIEIPFGEFSQIDQPVQAGRGYIWHSQMRR